MALYSANSGDQTPLNKEMKYIHPTNAVNSGMHPILDEGCSA
jgi:hypothetical protein